MAKFKHYMGEHQGAPVEALIQVDELTDSSPEDFFLVGTENIELLGDIEMTGSSEHYLTSFYKSEA